MSRRYFFSFLWSCVGLASLIDFLFSRTLFLNSFFHCCLSTLLTTMWWWFWSSFCGPWLPAFWMVAFVVFFLLLLWFVAFEVCLLYFQVEHPIPLVVSGVIDALSEFSTTATILIRPSACSSSPIPRPCGPCTDISYLPLRPAVNVVLPFVRVQQPCEWVLLRCLLPGQRLLWRTGGIGEHGRDLVGRRSTAG